MMTLANLDTLTLDQLTSLQQALLAAVRPDETTGTAVMSTLILQVTQTIMARR
jgi:hypothetical protein